MTTTNTLDTAATIAQSIRMIESGSELVRITAPSIREARNLELIKNGLRVAGYNTPLVADIHYTPNAAEVAARIVEKVRINPGNYVDKNLRNLVEYSDSEYQNELDRIRDRFTPLVKICKEYGTAMRIGTNHGSLSDRIMSRFGDTPFGMVESAIEFIKVAERENYFNIVLSMKSSNPLVMIQAYRLLVTRLAEEQLKSYPLHLGVTEAGDGEDGRIKSAVGIGTLLADGLGDTIRVSLTEEPEAEIPVARALVHQYQQPSASNHTEGVVETSEDLGATQKEADRYITQHAVLQLGKVSTKNVATIGGDNVPRVFADLRTVAVQSMADLSQFGHEFDEATEKWTMRDQAAEFLYMGSSPLPFTAPSGTRQIIDFAVWNTLADKLYNVPLFSISEYASAQTKHTVMNVIGIDVVQASSADLHTLSADPTVVIVLHCDSPRYYQTVRQFMEVCRKNSITRPFIFSFNSQNMNGLEIGDDEGIVRISTEIGGLFADGYGSGLMLPSVRVAYGVLQATRLRMSKTEYISCPSCGRTLFDLQETTAMIRSKTDHLKGLKIGIMGCIVNGPGEMADADYGYVGSGPQKISLYRGHEIVKRSIPALNAVDELIALIKEDNRWLEPS